MPHVASLVSVFLSERRGLNVTRSHDGPVDQQDAALVPELAMCVYIPAIPLKSMVSDETLRLAG